MNLPHINVFSRHSNHFPHAFGPGIEIRMSQEAANEKGRLVLLDIKVNQAIVRVAKASVKEISITTKECALASLLQERNNFGILHSSSADLGANLSHSKSPLLQ